MLRLLFVSLVAVSSSGAGRRPPVRRRPSLWPVSRTRERPVHAARPRRAPHLRPAPRRAATACRRCSRTSRRGPRDASRPCSGGSRRGDDRRRQRRLFRRPTGGRAACSCATASSSRPRTRPVRARRPPDGTLDVRRVGMRGTWRGRAAPRDQLLQQGARRERPLLFPSVWGGDAAHRRLVRGHALPFPTAKPGTDLAAVVALVPRGAPSGSRSGRRAPRRRHCRRAAPGRGRPGDRRAPRSPAGLAVARTRSGVGR